MDSFDKKVIVTMVIFFLIFLGSIYYTIDLITTHSHEIASGAGSLAKDFMDSAKGEKK